MSQELDIELGEELKQEVEDDRREHLKHRGDIVNIKETLISLSSDIKYIIANQNKNDIKVEKIEKTLYGNGVPGITTRVSNIEVRCLAHNSTDKIITETKKNSSDIFWKIATIAISIIMIFITLHKG